MHDEPTPTVIERDAQEDSVILALLMLETSHRPWAVEEIAREMGRDVTDSLRRLYGGGLIHRHDGFVWASRAAVMADEIAT
jgi:predicted transcriptional regulator